MRGGGTVKGSNRMLGPSPLVDDPIVDLRFFSPIESSGLAVDTRRFSGLSSPSQWELEIRYPVVFDCKHYDDDEALNGGDGVAARKIN